jgi:uncharacterized protein (DUF697 family)
MTQTASNLDAATNGTSTDSLVSRMTSSIAEKITGLFDLVIHERRAHYAERPETRPRLQDLSKLIEDCAKKNALISGGMSLVPGPLGMLTVIPDIFLVTQNQLFLIYEIGVAHGQDKKITKELLAAVFASARGTSLGALVIVHGSKLIIKRASLRVFQQIVLLLGGKITQQFLKTSISRWLPVIGPAGMALWSYHSTKLIAAKAVEVFRQEIELEAEEVNTVEVSQVTTKPVESQPPTALDQLAVTTLQRNKLQVLINLMHCDGEAHNEEQNFITDLVNGMIADQQLTGEAKTELLAQIKTAAHAEVDLHGFLEQPDDSVGLMIDLVALARRDGEVQPAERKYLESVGKAVGFAATDLEELLKF